MMTQGQLPYQLKIENAKSSMTSFAGLPLYMDLVLATGLGAKIAKTLKAKKQGWSDLPIIISLMMLNLSGGDCVDDIERLESDEGQRLLMLRTETYGMKRKERPAYEKQWRKQKHRAFPSTSSIRRYLALFHNTREEACRIEGKAFIPSNNALLNCLVSVNKVLIEAVQKRCPSTIATLDQDATLSQTNKRSALYCYKKYKAYQPFNTYWHEQDILLHSEFRDGNVNAGFDQLRIFKEALELLPPEVETVCLRSDSAGCQQDLLKYCAEGKHERFGVIEFAIANKVTQAFKTAVLGVQTKNWHPIYKTDDKGCSIKTAQEWAEVCFVPNFVAQGKKSATYRYLAIREPMAVQHSEPVREALPFQTLQKNCAEYKLFGIVTNRNLPGNELINWHRVRCGQSEKVHSVEKTDLAGGQFPSDKFGANAAWWQIMVLSYNLNALMKRFILPDPLKTKRLKALRFHIIGVCGRFIQHARGLILKLSGGTEMIERFVLIRKKIAQLGQVLPLARPG